jgi:sodium-dependent dicarboxylate transporter 2/3/5
VLFLIVYLLNTRVLFPIKDGNVSGIANLIQQEINQLGKLSGAEKRVLLVLIGTAFLWIVRSQLNKLPFFENLSDPLIAVAAAIILFMIPVKSEHPTQLLEWKDMQKMPWGILLLFGGGSALAKGMVASELVDVIGHWLSNVEYAYPLLLIGAITFFSLMLTEVMSNVALVSVFVPLSFVIAQSLRVDEIQLAIPLTIASSCAFMFPISTPPNAIVFGSGAIEMRQMAKAGIWLNLISILLISVYCYYLVPILF